MRIGGSTRAWPWLNRSLHSQPVAEETEEVGAYVPAPCSCLVGRGHERSRGGAGGRGGRRGRLVHGLRHRLVEQRLVPAVAVVLR